MTSVSTSETENTDLCKNTQDVKSLDISINSSEINPIKDQDIDANLKYELEDLTLVTKDDTSNLELDLKTVVKDNSISIESENNKNLINNSDKQCIDDIESNDEINECLDKETINQEVEKTEKDPILNSDKKQDINEEISKVEKEIVESVNEDIINGDNLEKKVRLNIV